MFYREYEKISNFLYRLQLLKLRILGAKIGKNVKIYGKFKVMGNPKKLSIGDNVTINHGVFLNCRDYLTIGDNCRLSAYSKIYTASLTLEIIPRKHIQAPVTLEKNVWIAANAMIMQGVTVKENSVIAANSLLTKETSKNSLYMGIPAIKKKTLNIE